MKLGIISDVHAKRDAFEKVLENLTCCGLIVNLGDVVGGGGDANGTIKAISARKMFSVAGNHDLEALCETAGGDQDTPSVFGLMEESKTILRNWPLAITLKIGGEKYRFCHSHFIKTGKSVRYDMAGEHNAVDLFIAKPKILLRRP